MDQKVYNCKTNFIIRPGGSEAAANNTPDYEHIYQSQKLIVYCKISDIILNPDRPTYEKSRNAMWFCGLLMII